MKDSSTVSPHLFTVLFFIMKTSNLLHFIIAPTFAPKCPTHENYESIRQQICHGFRHGSRIHLEDKSHYRCQRGYFHSVSHLPLSPTAINTAPKVLSLDVPLLKKFITITRPAVPSRASPCGWHFVAAPASQR